MITNLNEIVKRDMADEERRQGETENWRESAGIGLPRIVIFLLWLAASAFATFFVGMSFQAKRDLRARRDFDAWLERVDREAEARARSMSNTELLQRFPDKETSR